MRSTDRVGPGIGTCTTFGCVRPRRSSVSPLCPACYRRQRAHGDARQDLITRKELAPLEARVRKILADGDGIAIERTLTKINGLLAEHAQSSIDGFHAGRAITKPYLQACHQITKVTATVDPIQTAVTIAALYLLQKRNPHRVVSDRALMGALVRQYRFPSGLAMGTAHNRKTDKIVGSFKPLPMKTTVALGKMVADAYANFVAFCLSADKGFEQSEAKAARRLREAYAVRPDGAVKTT